MISVFRRGVDEICALLGYYAAYSGNSLPAFRDNLSVPLPSNMGSIGCPETSIRNYHYTLRNITDERRSRLINFCRRKRKFA